MTTFNIRTRFVFNDYDDAGNRLPISVDFWCDDNGGPVYVSRATDYPHCGKLGHLICKNADIDDELVESNGATLAKDARRWLAAARHRFRDHD